MSGAGPEEEDAELMLAIQASLNECRPPEVSGHQATFEAELAAVKHSRSTYVAEGGGCSFWFLRADIIRLNTTTEFPRFQDLRPGKHLELIHVSKSEAYHHELAGRFCAVSHCWELQNKPDMTGAQLRAVTHFLCEHPAIEFVWIDWCCMPQKSTAGVDDRTAEEKADFKRMLDSVNLLYLASTVLVLCDVSYPSRFWCLFECWLALQLATPRGLESVLLHEDDAELLCSTRRTYGRAHFVLMHLAKAYTLQQLIGLLGREQPEEIFRILSSPDIRVTNQSDKDSKLPEVINLSDLVVEVFAAH